MTRLEEKLQGIRNYNVLVEEDEDGVHFLHKIIPGKASDSYGIEVARLAGLPDDLINNASKILNHLENNEQEDSNISKIVNKISENHLDNDIVSNKNLNKNGEFQNSDFQEKKIVQKSNDQDQEKGNEFTHNIINKQMRLFEDKFEKENDKLIKKLLKKDLLSLTPIDAMNFLYKLQQEARKGN